MSQLILEGILVDEDTGEILGDMPGFDRAAWAATRLSEYKAQIKAYEQAAAQLKGKFQLAKVDTQELPELAARHAIRSIPTLVLFYKGRELARQSGALPAAEIVRWSQLQAARAGLTSV